MGERFEERDGGQMACMFDGGTILWNKDGVFEIWDEAAIRSQNGRQWDRVGRTWGALFPARALDEVIAALKEVRDRIYGPDTGDAEAEAIAYAKHLEALLSATR